MNRTARSLLVTASLVLCAAMVVRAGDPAGSPRRIAPPARIPDVVAPEPGPRGQPVSAASIPRAVRRAVVADAARRFAVSESSVVLARAETVTWSDGALGCPPAGASHVLTLVPGFRITAVTAAGQLLYHADSLGNLVTCR